MRLTSNERRALAEFKGHCVDWNKVHGRTLHALQRKKLIEGRGKGGGWRLTPAGRAQLDVPDVFADLFEPRQAAREQATKIVARYIEARDIGEDVAPSRTQWTIDHLDQHETNLATLRDEIATALLNVLRLRRIPSNAFVPQGKGRRGA